MIKEIVKEEKVEKVIKVIEKVKVKNIVHLEMSLFVLKIY